MITAGLVAGRDLGLLVVGGVEVRGLRGELGGAGVDRLVDRADAERVPDLADDVLAQAADLGDLRVGEAVPLGLGEQLGVELVGGGQLVRDLLDQEQLVDEPGVDLRGLEDLLRRGAGADGLHDGVDPAVGRAGPPRRSSSALSPGSPVKANWRALLLQRAQRLLERLGEVAADRHGLADRLHGGGEGGVGGRELLEGEPRRLDDDVVERRLEGGRGLLGDVVGDLVERVADGELGGDLGDREAGGLRRERRGAGDARVHLDDDDPAVARGRPRTGCCSRRCRRRPRG